MMTTKNMVLLVAILMLADMINSQDSTDNKSPSNIKKNPKRQTITYVTFWLFYQNFMHSQIVSTFSQISACACHSEISLSSNRDTNGYCSCNNGYDGEKCDPCQISSDEFPNYHSGGKFIV